MEEQLSAVEAGPKYPGPFEVGAYARKIQAEMRKRAKVQLIGEVTGVGRSKVQAYFELRDSDGAVPCAIWLNDLEKCGLGDQLRDGVEVVASGGLDYYPGGGQASPMDVGAIAALLAAIQGATAQGVGVGGGVAGSAGVITSPLQPAAPAVGGVATTPGVTTAPSGVTIRMETSPSGPPGIVRSSMSTGSFSTGPA